jgi:hypothetical protein
MTAFDLLPLAVTAVLVGLAYLRRRLMKAAQALRLELAERGERFFRDEAAPPRIRGQVQFMLDHAFGQTWMMLCSVIAVPFAVPFMVLRGSNLLQMEADRRGMTPTQRAEHFDLLALHGRIMLANHPIMLPLVEFEMFLVTLPLILAVAAINGDLLPGVNHASVLSALESGGAPFRRRHAVAT